MMSRKLTVSPSPHIHSGDSTQKIMYGVLIALVPAFAVSVFTFGIDALVVTAVAVLACLLFEWLLQKYLLKGNITILDGSAAITGVLLAFNIPSGLPVWMIILGSFVAIAVGKMSFGGLGQNPFNPALVGRVFLLLSFGSDMTHWPLPQQLVSADSVSGATPLGVLAKGMAQGHSMSEITTTLPDYSDMLFGFIGGSIGEISALALLLGGVYMLLKKIISWHIPVAVLVSAFVFSGVLYLVNPDKYIDPVFHLLTGGLMLGAIFMATDMVTSPMTKKGMLIFGAGIGVITIAIRVFGAYPEGISFAILIMNAFVPLINKYIRPTVFGAKK